MVKIKAYIELGRKTSFYSGYRPLFNFVNKMKISGQISLIDIDKFSPGEKGFVKIFFLNEKLIDVDLKKGLKFTFDEGVCPLGEGIITEILDEESD